MYSLMKSRDEYSLKWYNILILILIAIYYITPFIYSYINDGAQIIALIMYSVALLLYISLSIYILAVLKIYDGYNLCLFTIGLAAHIGILAISVIYL
jgi:hypothetical protein